MTRLSALLALATLCAACAHTPGVMDAGLLPATARPNTVAVVVRPAQTTTRVDEPTSRLGGAGAGAIKGAVGTTAVLGMVAGPGGALLGVFLTPVTAVVGAVAGALDTAKPDTVSSRVAAIERASAAFDVPAAVLEGVLATARNDRPRLVSPGPDGAQPADMLLEIEVARVALERSSLPAPAFTIGLSLAAGERQRTREWLSTDKDPSLTLEMRMVTRLRDGTGHALFERAIDQRGPTRPFSVWADDDARALTESLAEMCRELAVRIVDELL